jgi:phosphoribosylformylglycinamidine synthase
LVGVNNDGPSDACVLKPLETAGTRGIVLANGINPEIGKVDSYAMAVSAVDEAIRNAVAVGANPKRIAILDNFCFGNPKRPEVLHSLIEAARGCYDAAILHRTPFISGKDSLNNEYVGADGKRRAIPATLLISAIGIIDDVKTAVSMDFKEAGNIVYLLGETKAHFGGSHWNIVTKKADGFVPELAPHAPLLYDCLHQAIKNGFVRACHDLSEGGLAVAAAEMCIAGRLGCRFTIVGDHLTALFSESNARFLVEVEPSNQSSFENYFTADIRHLLLRIGVVTNEDNLVAEGSGRELFNISLDSLLNAYFANHEI